MYLIKTVNLRWQSKRPVLEDDSIAKVGQNIKADALALRRRKAHLKGIHFDTMIASYVLNPGLKQHDLDTLVQQHQAFHALGQVLASEPTSPAAWQALECASIRLIDTLRQLRAST